MKIGIIADIHSNLPCLRAVLESIPPVELLLCAGDMIDRYYAPDEVFDLLEQYHVQSIQGNHEDGIFAYYHVQKNGAPTQRVLKCIVSAPEKLEIQLNGKRLLMVHGSPWNYRKEYLYPESDKLPLLAALGFDFVILGHTHVPMVKNLSGVTIINPGSCGQPMLSDPRPSYALLDSETGEASIQYLSVYLPEEQLRYYYPLR
ncbi:MAG: metallophosphoesterase family protein [Candidatus Tectomicrobia bacterium]|uniref:Phosphoesterase n=1 Tax=Tectimicrobiota bacterium TaxID=2528274 RepID=A0A933GMK2_UNCTE|nr:metallophosphoesterase family protein [Candidatus Tectomicrobia bacterium]